MKKLNYEKRFIFKEKSLKNEEWYFPVSSDPRDIATAIRASARVELKTATIKFVV